MMIKVFVIEEYDEEAGAWSVVKLTVDKEEVKEWKSSKPRNISSHYLYIPPKVQI